MLSWASKISNVLHMFNDTETQISNRMTNFSATWDRRTFKPNRGSEQNGVEHIDNIRCIWSRLASGLEPAKPRLESGARRWGKKKPNESRKHDDRAMASAQRWGRGVKSATDAVRQKGQAQNKYTYVMAQVRG